MGIRRPFAVFACLPPIQSAIAKYTLRSLLGSDDPIHFFTHQPSVGHWRSCQKLVAENSLHRVYHVDSFAEAYRLHSYDESLFILGNSYHHQAVLGSFLRYSKLYPMRTHIHIHEAQLTYAWLSLFSNHDESLLQLYKLFYLEERKALTSIGSIFENQIYGLRPLAVMGNLTSVVTNSAFCSQIAVQEFEGLIQTPTITQAFLPVIGMIEKVTKSNTQNIPDSGTLRIGSFGIPHAVKHLGLLVEACRILTRRHKKVQLVLAGPGMVNYLRQNHLLEDFVQAVDNPNDEEMSRLMDSVDIGVQLRWPSHGESSACINELLVLGKRVVVTDIGSFSGLRNFVVLTPEGIDPLELSECLIASTQFSPDVKGYLNRFSVERFRQRLYENIGLRKE